MCTHFGGSFDYAFTHLAQVIYKIIQNFKKKMSNPFEYYNM